MAADGSPTLTPLARYTAVASALGFAPGDLLAAHIVEFCRSAGITVHSLETVERQMGGAGEHKRPWNWVPLRERDLSNVPSPYWTKQPATVPYSRLVPLEHLLNAQRILAAFPDLKLFVAESVEPDPFIAAWGETMRVPVVFGQWLEPGFGT